VTSDEQDSPGSQEQGLGQLSRERRDGLGFLSAARGAVGWLHCFVRLLV